MITIKDHLNGIINLCLSSDASDEAEGFSAAADAQAVRLGCIMIIIIIIIIIVLCVFSVRRCVR